MSTHNICFYEEISKIISKLSSNTHLISSYAPMHYVPFVDLCKSVIISYFYSKHIQKHKHIQSFDDE